MTSLLNRLRERVAFALVARLSPASRYKLAKQLLAESPKDDRERLLVNSPGFVAFARAFLLAAGRSRTIG